MAKGVCVHCNTTFDVFDNVVECEACQAVMKVTGWEPVELELIKPGTRMSPEFSYIKKQDLYKYTTGGRRFLAGIITGAGINSPNLNTLQMVIAFAEFAWFVAEILTMLTNKKRRALHDFIAGTVVVRV